MHKCDFCGQNLEPGTGKMYVKKDGKILYFCSSKCEKNLHKFDRKPRTTRWTAEFAHIKKKGGQAKE